MEPIDPRVACASVPDPEDPDESVAGSQAALLLAARLGVLGITATEQADLAEATRRGGFGLPDLPALRRERRLTVREAQEPVGGDPRALAAATAPEVQATMSVAAEALYLAPSVSTAAGLFEVGLHSPHPLVRVAAAAGARETTRARPGVLATLRAGVMSPDPLVASLARTVLGSFHPDDPALGPYVGGQGEGSGAGAAAAGADSAGSGDAGPSPAGAPPPGASPTVAPPTSTAPPADPPTGAAATDAPPTGAPPAGGAVVTHGTWGAEGTWYRPGGDFWTRLSAERPDLAVHDPSFTWSGAYSDAGRRLAAQQLVAWCTAQGLVTPDLLAHSHGSTVGNLATTDGLALDRLVYMGWPVHAEWFPDASRVARVIDIRVNLDLVIMADRGGQRIRNAPFPVEEHVNGWFDHTSTHQPSYWDEHGLWAVL